MADRLVGVDWDDELGLDREHAARRYGDAEFFPGEREFFPGERIGAPPPHRARRTLARMVAVTMCLLGVYAVWHTRASWQPWLSGALELLNAQIDQRRDLLRPGTTPQEPPVPAAALPPLTAAKEIEAVPGDTPSPPPAAPGTQTQPPPSASTPVADEAPAADIETSSTGTQTPAPLPTPEIDPKDSYQKRAASVGLHPGVSRVLLVGMSDTDYHNAGIAIRKALADARDDEKFVWPRERNARLALFQVHFVKGAGPQCRRYIVTIVKNGWTTTAPPMEKCGGASKTPDSAQQAGRDRAKASVIGPAKDRGPSL